MKHEKRYCVALTYSLLQPQHTTYSLRVCIVNAVDESHALGLGINQIERDETFVTNSILLLKVIMEIPEQAIKKAEGECR